jgi:hypothetical protein
MTVRPRAWTCRMSARIELTAVGLSSAARRERWRIVSRTASLLQSGKVEKVEEVEEVEASWQVQRADARATSCDTQPCGFCFMRSVVFRAVLTDFAKILASSRAS